MRSSSRTLIALTGGAIVLAISVILLIRSGPSRAEARSAGSRPSSSRALLSQAPEESASREIVDTKDSVVTLSTGSEDSEPTPSPMLGLVLDDATGQPIDRFDILHSTAGLGRSYVDTILGYESPEPATSDTFVGTRGRFEIEEPDARPQSLCAFAEGYERSDPITVHRSGNQAQKSASAVGVRTGGSSVGDVRSSVAGVRAMGASDFKARLFVDPHSTRNAAAAENEELVIRLRRASVVRGRVVDPETGVPVENALVGWIDYRGRTRTGTRERFERTDRLGRFVLGSVPLSAKRILAGREDLGEGLSDRLELAPGELEQEIVIELRRSGS